RNGHVTGARFTPDGVGIVYGASWDGRPYEIYSSRLGSPESRSLGLPPGSLLSMSKTGEMAVSLGYHNTIWFQVAGTLARVPLAGGGARPVQKLVGHADWSADGKTMAIVRYRDGRCLLEYPSGNLLLETENWLGHCRVSPDGRHVAFGRHRSPGEGAADLCVVDESRTVRVLARDATNLNGIAWSPAGDEVWWSGINAAQAHGIWAADLTGREREIHVSPVRLTLHDVRTDGGTLLTIDDLRTCLMVGGDSDSSERDLSWFDGSVVSDLSADGEQVLFIEAHEAENPHYACYLRQIDGSPAIRLGGGSVSRFSADGQWVVTNVSYPVHHLALYPTGFGEPRPVPLDGVDRIWWAGFHPDGQQLFLVASSPERPNRLYRVSIDGGTPELLLDEHVQFDRFVGLPVSADGDRIVLGRVTGEHVSFRVSTKTMDTIDRLTPADIPLRFDESGSQLFFVGGGSTRRSLDRLDLASGERTPLAVLEPPSPMGLIYMTKPVVSADGGRYAYSFMRVVSNLYLVEGLV
ncbi:MAG: PD40 domain-containing protein, partial [Candidatus Eisenbacteria bacterium]|nr:PD40 domain-containing protein [Candidatus Eisenbacteria bacterium]